MDPTEAMKSDGWSLSEAGWQKVTENGSLTNRKQVEKNALDTDIRELGGCSFPAELTKGKLDSVSGTFVVQVQKVRNISAPKANEESKAAPRLLRLTLTDGTQTVQSLEMSHISAVSMMTVPGTKLRLCGEMFMSHGLLLLHNSNVTLLGGHVSNMADKWTLNRSLAKQMRGQFGVEGGPPPWIPFGQKIAPTNLTDKNFKSLDDGSGKENAKDNEFEAQRRDAIAEAGRAAGVKKVFGGGGASSRQLVDRNVQAVMEQGFSQQQAEAALKQSKNNVKKAIKNLQRRTGVKGSGDGKDKGDKEGKGGGGRRKGGGGDDDGGGGGQPKPSGRVCLFQFLADKLPAAAINPVSTADKEREKEREWDHQPKGIPEKSKPSYAPSSRNHPNNSSNNNSGGYSGGRGSGGSGGPHPRIRDDRRHNSAQSNQKAPRFQNQSRQQQQHQYNSNNNYGGGASSYHQPHHQQTTTTHQYGNDQHSNHQPMNSGRNVPPPLSHHNSAPPTNQFAGSNNSGGSKSYYKQHGMPDIPEFPYKDSNAFLPPLMSNSIGYFQDSHHSNSTSNKCGPKSSMMGSTSAVGNPTTVFHPVTTTAPTPTIANPRAEGEDGDIDRWWDVGDRCMAKYWEDSLYYNAEITGLSKKTCVVKFLNYGNYEEVLHEDCIPITAEDGSCFVQVDCGMVAVVPMHNNTSAANRNSNNHFTGPREFRRGGSRPHVQQQQRSANEGGGGGGSGGRQRTGGQRYSQPVYLPPASRARAEATVHQK